MEVTHPEADQPAVPAVLAGEAELAVTGLRAGFGDNGADLAAAAEVTRIADLAEQQ